MVVIPPSIDDVYKGGVRPLAILGLLFALPLIVMATLYLFPLPPPADMPYVPTYPGASAHLAYQDAWEIHSTRVVQRTNHSTSASGQAVGEFYGEELPKYGWVKTSGFCGAEYYQGNNDYIL